MRAKERIFRAVCARADLPEPVAEWVFAHDVGRKWRFDYAWIAQRVALEVEGGVWTRGRHTRSAGFLADCEKYNEAAARGWLVLRTTPTLLATRATLDLIARALARRMAA